MNDTKNIIITNDWLKIREEANCQICGKPSDPFKKPALICRGNCESKIHMDCLQHGTVAVSLIGDVFFELFCSKCSPFNEEKVVRARMPWLTVIVLTLHNLREKSSGISNRGYFHWKADITTFVDRNWDYLFKKSVKRKKNWIGTISGTLSHYSGIFFESGTSELGESGWWRLIGNDPPEILIARNSKMISKRKKQNGKSAKLINKICNSPTQSESSLSVGEDSNFAIETSKIQPISMYSQAYVQPTEILSDFLMEEDELNADIDMIDMDDGIELQNCNFPFLDIMQDFHQSSDSHIPHLLENISSDSTQVTDTEVTNLSLISENTTKHEINQESELFSENSIDSANSNQENMPEIPVSLFNTSDQKPQPWRMPKFIPPDENLRLMTRQEEEYILQSVNKSDLEFASPSVRRTYRKLAVRKLKRERGLKLFDLKDFFPSSKSFQKSNRVLDRYFGDDLNYIFEQRLQGYNEPTSVRSPYTQRLLLPFIRRDTECRPLWLKLMDELLIKVNKNKPGWKLPPNAPIDYCYVRPQHIPAINSLCNRFFWPGINMTECLQYPDFSCVVLYKKLVIGFAFLVPDVGYNEAYISFFLTRPEWRKSGIGHFMLYHLIQTCMGKDVTLHVSATNPALILYQKFGFKQEEFIQNFYDKYIPPNSRECRHAFFLRLSR